MLRISSFALGLLMFSAQAACSSSDSPTASGGAPGSGGADTASGGSGTGGDDTTTGGSDGSGGAGTGGSQSDGGMAGTAGSAGSPSGGPTAIAEITGFGATATLSGTATFTQGETEVTLILSLENCPEGTHAAHLHENKSCANNATGAGLHWVPNGEELGNFTCDAQGTTTHTVSKPISTWTVGGDDATDVTQFSIVVHTAGDPQPGDRIACGLVNLVE